MCEVSFQFNSYIASYHSFSVLNVERAENCMFRHDFRNLLIWVTSRDQTTPSELLHLAQNLATSSNLLGTLLGFDLALQGLLYVNNK